MRDGMMYEQGDIILIPVPYSDLTGNKKRSALVISNNTFLTPQDKICCLITSKESTNRIIIRKNQIKGTLPLQSWIKAHRVFTVDNRIIHKKICSIEKKLLSEVVKSVSSMIAT